MIGKTSELVLFGARLAPDGASPSVSLGEQQLNVTAVGNELVAIDLASLSASAGSADSGYQEHITTFHPRKRDPADPQRQIRYDAEPGRPRGIVVSGSARSDTTLTPGGTRGEFRATYTVFGRRLNAQGRGADWTFNGRCVISGTVSCGSFDVLEEFVDPPTYTVNATLIDSEGNLVSVSGPVRPNDATSWLPAVLTIEDSTGQLQIVSVRLTVLEEPATITIDFEIPGPFGGTRQIIRSVRRA